MLSFLVIVYMHVRGRKKSSQGDKADRSDLFFFFFFFDREI